MSDYASRIVEIRLQNFKAFENVRLRFDDLTFLVGRNGAGKSSLLDAIEFMREAVTDSLPNALERRNGFEGIFRRGASSAAPLTMMISVRVEWLHDTSTLLYGFRLRNGGHSIEEVFKVDGKLGGGFRRWDDEFLSDDFSVVPPAGRLVLPLAVATIYQFVWHALARSHAYSIDPFQIADLNVIGNTTTLNHHGSNAADVFDALRSTDEFRSIRETMAAIVPGACDIRIRTVQGHRMLELGQRIGDGTEYFTASQMSQGTLRAFAILLALHQRPRRSLVLLDEIEDSLHPRAIAAIIESAAERAAEFPVVVCTHSPEVLSDAHATPDRIRIVQWNNGESNLYRVSAGTLQSVDAVTTPGDLLRHNALWPHDAPERFNEDDFAREP